MFIVFDLDGTMCDGSHKNHLLEHPGPDGVWPDQDWQPWIEACEFDLPIAPIVAVAEAMIAAGHRVEFWTGRGEHCRAPTERWMKLNGFATIPLIMRPMDKESALAPDPIVKARFLLGGVPDLIFEDKPSVVAMWRELGIPVAAVQNGNPNAAERRATRTEKAA